MEDCWAVGLRTKLFGTSSRNAGCLSGGENEAWCAKPVLGMLVIQWW